MQQVLGFSGGNSGFPLDVSEDAELEPGAEASKKLILPIETQLAKPDRLGHRRSPSHTSVIVRRSTEIRRSMAWLGSFRQISTWPRSITIQ
jgi:hypothetical protein